MFTTSSGLMERPVTKNGHSHGKYLLTTHRTAPTSNPDCQRAYTSGADRYKRTTPVTVREGQNRVRFSTISRAVRARMQDLSKVQADQASFLAQKDLPNGKTTMLSYLFKLEGDAYDEQHE